MVAPTSILASLVFVASRALALPSAAVTTGSDLDAFRNTTSPKLVHAEVVNGYLWTIYDDESLPLLSADEGRLERRCGSNAVGCDYYNNRAIAGICGLLMDAMGDPGNRDRSVTPFTSQCFTATNIPDNNRCCITWSRRVDGVKVHYLFPAAASTLRQCTRNDLVSGWASDVDLAGACVTQCMSNRETGCLQ